jgi:hypothetical protein
MRRPMTLNLCDSSAKPWPLERQSLAYVQEQQRPPLVVVVMEDGAAREAPLAAILFDQLAGVAAGRKATQRRALRATLAGIDH